MHGFGFHDGAANPGYSVGVNIGGPYGGHTAGTLAGSWGQANTETGGSHHNTWTNTNSNSGSANGAAGNQYYGFDKIYGTGKAGSIKGGSGGSGGGGVSIPNPLEIAFRAGWGKLVKPLFDKITKPLQSGMILKQAAAAAVNDVRHGIYKMIDDKIPDTIGGNAGSGKGGTNGKYTGGGNLDSWIKDGYAFGNALPYNSGNAANTKNLIMGESSGNPNAVQQIHDVNSGGNEAHGITQIIPGTWAAHQKEYGQDAGAYNDNWMNPVRNIGVSLRYQKDQYGYAVGHSGYDKGGYIKRDHVADVHRNELYMPLDAPHVEKTAQTALGTKELREEVTKMREEIGRELRHQSEQMKKTEREHVRAVIAGIHAAPGSGKWMEEVDYALSLRWVDHADLVGGN